MWKDSIEAIGLLSVIVVPVVIAFCIVGSMIAAVRAVGRGSHTENRKRGRMSSLRLRSPGMTAAAIATVLCRSQLLGVTTRAEGKRKDWRELCRAALDAKDPDELLEIAPVLGRVLKSEEQLQRDFRSARSVNSSAGQARG
jgi:hypothetical protein